MKWTRGTGNTRTPFSFMEDMEKNIYKRLLKKYCDALLSVQDKGKDKAFRGGIWCRSCKMIHGRCPDAVYGFVVMAKLSGKKKYLNAAKEVFAYGENMLCTDGALYNDAQANWRYTTTFHQIAVIEALRAGKDILDKKTKSAFEKRAKGMAEWLYQNLDEHSPANINYATTNGLALALSGNYFGVQKYLDRAHHLVSYALKHISESGLLYGESKPHDKVSSKGCRSVDVGYNVEESLPALVKYAHEIGDEKLMDDVLPIVSAHFDFLFPDGGWDNSFGNRNNKWTYWGSRTSDGCAPMLLLLADKNPAFAEGAYRNTQLLEKCSPDGFLYGGPDYKKNGEHACTHHLFEHVNSIAFALENIDEKYLRPQGVEIPSDKREGCTYYPEVNTWRFIKGDYLATITDYDFDVYFSGHATGGTLTALHHKTKGPMVMASVTDYVLVEPTNMQQTLKRDKHRPLVPRFTAVKDGVEYVSSFYQKATTSFEKTDEEYTVKAQTGLTSKNDQTLDGVHPKIAFTLGENGLKIEISDADDTKYVLPLICGNLTVLEGEIEKQEEIFFLTGGFIAQEYTLTPKNGKILIKID